MNDDISVTEIVDDRKRDNEDEAVPRKRLKLKGQEDSETEIEIVL